MRKVQREMWWPERVRRAYHLLEERNKLAATLDLMNKSGNVELPGVGGLTSCVLGEMLLERLAKLEKKLKRIGVEVGT